MSLPAYHVPAQPDCIQQQCNHYPQPHSDRESDCAQTNTMHVADILKEKIRRRRGLKLANIGEVNGVSVANTTDEPGRRRSPRVLRKRPGCAEAMPTDREIEHAKEVLNHQFQIAKNSTVYKERRQRLVAAEATSEWSWDAPARLRASQTEVEANEILIKIRENERVDPNLFGDLPSEAVPESSTRDMGGRFLINKPRIEQSKTFQIASAMPKGAHLHLHMNAELPPEQLLVHARDPRMEDNMFIRCTCPLLTSEDFLMAEIVFDVLPKETPRGNVFSSSYNPDWKATNSNSWMRWVDFRRKFPETGTPMENTAADSDDLICKAEYWVREKMIITIKHAYAERQTLNGAWACFNQGTRAFKGIVNYESVYRWYIGAAIDSMIRDKVMYAELRPMLLDKTIPSDDGKHRLDHKAQMDIVCEELEAKKKCLIREGKLEKFPFGIKIIYCTPRSISREKMEVELKDCLDLKLRFPDLICGFDLVGAEDRPHHIGYYADLLVGFADTCKELGVSIPFIFHAGESLLDTGGSQDPQNSNLLDAFLLKSKRVGHGYSILKHPLLVQKFRESNICLELCPTSNELLHLCSNIRQHRFAELLAAGLHCTLNADNPALYRGPGRESKSLSHEFCQVMMGDPRMTIHGWKQLAEWSIEYACLSQDERARAMEIFHREWTSFCQWVVDKYAHYSDSLEDLVHAD